jgi:hypothetical protein
VGSVVVIPGRIEDASYDVQWHIGESIAPLERLEKWIPGPRQEARPGMTAEVETQFQLPATEFRRSYEKITRPKNRGRRESRVPSRHP